MSPAIVVCKYFCINCRAHYVLHLNIELHYGIRTGTCNDDDDDGGVVSLFLGLSYYENTGK